MATLSKPKRKSPQQVELSTENTPLQPKADERPIWEVVAELGSQISEEDWKQVPDDSSINYKNHLYGAPAKRA